LQDLISRDAVFYNKTMFTAFLGYSKKQVEQMAIDEYLKCMVMITEVLKLWHAPFQKQDND
jgi:hypothetical protein